MGDLIAKYGLDGLDLDLEGGSFTLNAGDTDFTKPTTPAVVNMISAVKMLKQRFDPNFILTMAPEVAYVQGAATHYGGIWGAYLPVIHGLRNDLQILQVQLYNTGGNVGSDGATYNSGTQDFLTAMSDMLITGFRLGSGATGTSFFPGLRADQVALGLPSGTKSASSGYTTPANVQRAVECLVKGTDCAAYKPKAKHAEFRGLMTWSINWDKADGYNFSGPHRTYLNQLA